MNRKRLYSEHGRLTPLGKQWHRRIKDALTPLLEEMAQDCDFADIRLTMREVMAYDVTRLGVKAYLSEQMTAMDEDDE